jgi:hypothetical protein
LQLVPKARPDLIEHVAGFATVPAIVIMLIEPVCDDQAKTQHDDSAHCTKRLRRDKRTACAGKDGTLQLLADRQLTGRLTDRSLRRSPLASAPRSPEMPEGKYTIELCSPGGPDAGVEGVVASDDDLTTARKLYRLAAAADPERVILLCGGGRILSRSDKPGDIPE